MKTMYLFLLSFVLAVPSFAQINPAPYPRIITVNGSAELEIIPDEIYVQVNLKEYDKKGGGKVTIDKIRQDFLTAVRSLGLPDTVISVSGYDANNYNPWWNKKNKKQELHAAITYQVKLKNSAQADQLVDKLDDNATQNFYISSTTHSKLEEIRKNLKIQAVKAAKEKADYLAEAINAKIGVPVTINEPGEYYQPYYGTGAMHSNTALEKERLQSRRTEQPQADFKRMKMRYDVTVVFELK